MDEYTPQDKTIYDNSDGTTEDTSDNTPPEAFDQAFNEPFFVETIKHETSERQGRHLRRFIALAVIISIIGGSAIGFGYGVGTRLASDYLIPRLKSDKNSLQGFTIKTSAYREDLDIATGIPGYSYAEIIEIAEPAVVIIQTLTQGFSGRYGYQSPLLPGAGSGMIFHETDNNYYIATNAHVVSGAETAHVYVNGSDGIPARLIGKDEDADIAVIAISKSDAVHANVLSAQLIAFGDSDTVRVGDVVLSIGNALGEGNTVTDGIISAKNKQITIDGQTLSVIQTNAAINKGNSGGPLLNMYGEVIGMNTAKLLESSVEGMGYSIPSNVLIPIIEEIMRGGKPMIGITGSDMPLQMAEEAGNPPHGVLIASVLEDSAAQTGGLMAGDIITSFNDILITSMKELQEEIAKHKAGDLARVKYVRGGIEYTVEIILGEYVYIGF